jgi:hypothetical protein
MQGPKVGNCCACDQRWWFSVSVGHMPVDSALRDIQTIALARKRCKLSVDGCWANWKRARAGGLEPKLMAVFFYVRRTVKHRPWVPSPFFEARALSLLRLRCWRDWMRTICRLICPCIFPSCWGLCSVRTSNRTNREPDASSGFCCGCAWQLPAKNLRRSKS